MSRTELSPTYTPSVFVECIKPHLTIQLIITGLSLDSGCKGRVYPAGKGQLFFPQKLHLRWPYSHALYAMDHYLLLKAGHCFTIVDTELPDVQQQGSGTLSPHLRNGPLFQIHFSMTSGMLQM